MVLEIVLNILEGAFVVVCLYIAYRGCKQDMRTSATQHPLSDPTMSDVSECTADKATPKCASEANDAESVLEPPSYTDVIRG